MQLTDMQKDALSLALEALGDWTAGGPVALGAMCVIEELLAAHNAGTQGEVAWRYKRPNTYYNEWLYIDAGKSADELRLGIPELAFSPDSDRKDWTPLYTHPQPMTDAARDAKRFAFLITNIKRYQLRESKGFWYYAPIASQDWQRGYRTAREAIDTIERGEREGKIDGNA